MPRARRTPIEPKALQLKITLAGVAPSIWRQVLLPPDASMWALHVAIQDAMGWNDSHLHAFRVESAAASEPIVIGIPTDVDVEPVIASWEIPLALVFRAAGDRVDYDYDFGDGWTHSVVLEAIVTTGKAVRKPVCIGGERACPPDDCGGVPGYEELLKALRNPTHPEHREMKRWAPKGFDPERFDPKKLKFDDPEKRLQRMMS